MFRSLFAVAALALAVESAGAVVLPAGVQHALNQRYDEFASASGFSRVDPAVVQHDWYTPSRFPDAAAQSMRAPDAGLNAATRALMLLEGQEAPLPHVRYRVTYRLDNAPDFGGYPNAYVEVSRFNLGPVRHADVIESTPAGVPVAPAGYFGVGPNLSWRFVMGWSQSHVAEAVRASRRVLSETEAAAMDCLGAPCLSLESSQGPSGAWQPVEAPGIAPPAYVAHVDSVATAARISELLYRHASGGQPQVEALAVHNARPQLTFVISMNVDGQDHAANGLLHQQQLFDDAISDIWTRRLDAGSGAVQWQQLVQYHVGRQ